MDIKIHINEDGTINAIGYVETYSHICPEFINFDNFTKMKCININNYINPESWIDINNIHFNDYK
jgi:hypothetical protein